jgi:hypothetical protein
MRLNRSGTARAKQAAPESRIRIELTYHPLQRKCLTKRPPARKRPTEESGGAFAFMPDSRRFNKVLLGRYPGRHKL